MVNLTQNRLDLTDIIESYLDDDAKIKIMNLGVNIRNKPSINCQNCDTRADKLYDDVMASLLENMGKEAISSTESLNKIQEDEKILISISNQNLPVIYENLPQKEEEELKMNTKNDIKVFKKSRKIYSPEDNYVSGSLNSQKNEELHIVNTINSTLKKLNKLPTKVNRYKVNMYSNSKKNSSNSNVSIRKPTIEVKEKTKEELKQEVFEIAEQIAYDKGQKSDTNLKTVERFVLDKPILTHNIDECLQIDDLKTANLIGRIHKKGGNRKYQNNLFHIKKGFFVCYNSKKYKISEINQPDIINFEMINPDDTEYFMKPKYIFLIKHLKIFLVINGHLKQWFSKLRSFCVENEQNLIEITNKNIENIIETTDGFKVVLSSATITGSMYIEVPLLEFALQYGDGYYFYRPNSTNSFLRWIFAIKNRITTENNNIFQ